MRVLGSLAIGLHPERVKALEAVEDMMVRLCRATEDEIIIMEKIGEDIYTNEKVEDYINHRMSLNEERTDALMILFDVARRIAEA